MNRCVRSLLTPLIVLCAAALSPKPIHARGGLRLEAPAAQTPAASKNQIVWIRSVTDRREFQDRPATADIPSLAMGLASATPQIKSTAIARVRDGYGKARANVFLEDGLTVEALVRQTLANALTSLGYTVVNDEAQAGENPMIVDVDIEKFWGWVRVNPGGGFTGSGAMYMDGAFDTRLHITNPDQTTREAVVTATAANRLGLGVTAANWLKMFNLLLNAYSENARAAFAPASP